MLVDHSSLQGMSGARILTHLTHEAQRRNAKLSIGSACIGGGQVPLCLRDPSMLMPLGYCAALGERQPVTVRLACLIPLHLKPSALVHSRTKRLSLSPGTFSMPITTK
jgi:hypothetical protein